MTWGARIALVASVVSAAIVWGAVTGVHSIAGLALAVAVGSLLRPRLPDLSAPLQGFLLLACGLMGLVLTTLHPSTSDLLAPELALGDRALHRGWAVLGSGSLLLACSRTQIRNPEGGVVVTVGLALLCFLACGSVLSGSIYLVVLLPALALMFMAVHLADSDRAPWPSFGMRHRMALLGLCVVSGLATALLLAAIPSVYDRASSWALRLVDDEIQVGFHDGPVRLGSLEGMLDSDEIVLRVEGKVGERLRGSAYSHYAGAVWSAAPATDRRSISLSDQAAGDAQERADAAVIRHAGSEGDRFFLPLQAEAVWLSPSQVRIDPYGIARPVDRKSPVEARVLLGSTRRLEPAPPGLEDVDVPESLRRPLEEIAGEWTREATTPLERVHALQDRLESEYQYSLQFERREGTDALLQFLLNDRQGHCEYFASALTLLARASGLPARMVTGYRVSERNPLGGYWIVRERHAHAWAEVHLGDAGWVTVDASPIHGFEGTGARTTPWGAAFLDWSRVELRRRGPMPLLVILMLVFGGIQLRGLLAERTSHPRVAVEAATPGFVSELLGHLKAGGWDRAESETLEAFAGRLPQHSALRGLTDARHLLGRAAALRYGGEGSPMALARDVRCWIRKVESSRQPGRVDPSASS